VPQILLLNRPQPYSAKKRKKPRKRSNW
jgi:hypothetical protein